MLLSVFFYIKPVVAHMDIDRLVKQLRKQSLLLLRGGRPTAILGRFVGPKVLVNSIPKSGTNLLQELILLLPLMRGQVTSTLHLDNGLKPLMDKLSRIRNGQCAPGHIAYDVGVDTFIQKREIRHVLIVRDFRDVIFSTINYLEHGHVSHPHNKLFAHLPTLDAKIQACLAGNAEFGIRALPDLIRDYKGWLDSGVLLVVRFESLVSQDREIAEHEIHRIIDYLGLRVDIDVSKVRENMFNPKGLTFNRPGVGKWKRSFKGYQIDHLNRALGDELVYFGYEV